jgi:hypothetical protein
MRPARSPVHELPARAHLSHGDRISSACSESFQVKILQLHVQYCLCSCAPPMHARAAWPVSSPAARRRRARMIGRSRAQLQQAAVIQAGTSMALREFTSSDAILPDREAPVFSRGDYVFNRSDGRLMIVRSVSIADGRRRGILCAWGTDDHRVLRICMPSEIEKLDLAPCPTAATPPTALGGGTGKH